MEWIKLPIDNVLQSEFTDSETFTLIKYQCLYCRLENKPSDVQLKRNFTSKQRKFLQTFSEVTQELINSSLKRVNKKRTKDREIYKTKQQLSKKPDVGTPTDRKRSDDPEKTRVQKIREDNNIYVPLANKLANTISGHKDINIDKVKIKKWANDIRLLCEKDGVNLDRIKVSLDWYHQNIGGDYVVVIESGKALREKFTRLEAASRRQNKTTNSHNYTTDENGEQIPW